MCSSDLSVGDMIVINYNNKQYEMSVLELKPANAVSIIECDMNVSLHLCNLDGFHVKIVTQVELQHWKNPSGEIGRASCRERV